ncbi:MAG TPA: uroporphyrinogen-III synthase [Puia sp.]|nr:uroporphyrinogen-III synthase [Puia sp.]
MPDPTIQVLSTRPLAPELIAGAAEKGISIDVIPFIRTEAVVDVALRQRVGVLGKQKLAAVFTSANAVEVVAEWTGGAKEWTIFCIGAATRQLVSRHFGEGSIADTAESALALAQKIADRKGAGDLFFFCGDLRREELPTTLREAGFRVNELVVYRTKAIPSVVEPRYRGVVFFSPSAVESFFSMNGVKAETMIFAIGGTTAATIKRFCSNPVIVSGQPDAAVLIGQVINYFQIKQ